MASLEFCTRVLCHVGGSGPMGKAMDSVFHTLSVHPPSLTLGAASSGSVPAPAARVDLDVGRGVPAFYIDGVLSEDEVDNLVALTEAFGYSSVAPGIQTPPGMRQNKAAHWFAPGETVEKFLNPMFARIRDLLPPSIDPGDRLYEGLSHRLAHYKYDSGDVFNMHTDGEWPGQSVNDAGDGVSTWDNKTVSKLSMVLYLSGEDPGGGGQTRLYHFDGKEPVDVAPKKGRALFFRHGYGPNSVPHAGLRVVGDAPKYVCRLNVLYHS